MLRVAMSRVLTPASFVWSEMVSDCVVRLSDALTRIMMARAVVPRKACVRKAHVAGTPNLSLSLWPGVRTMRTGITTTKELRSVGCTATRLYPFSPHTGRTAATPRRAPVDHSQQRGRE